MHHLHLSILLCVVLLCCACSAGRNDNANTTVTTIVAPSPTQLLTVVPQPDWIIKMMGAGGAANATPILTILSPRQHQTLEATTVKVRLSLRGQLQAYSPRYEAADKTVVGVVFNRDHVHIVLDNLPYEDCYDLDQPCELRNLTHGKHTLRVFAVRPWHESYKNNGSFQMITFNVRGVNESSSQSKGEPLDPAKPLLTYNNPKGEYEGEDANEIMLDFWLANAKLKGDGGEYRVRYIVDNDDAKYIDKWAPVWLQGWAHGKHRLRLNLVDKDGQSLENGGYNTTTREITIVR
jgi:hypothetical protein